MSHSEVPTQQFDDDLRTRISWFLSGASQIGSIPALILMTAHVGFAGLASENGISVLQAMFMVATIWALPANIVLIGAISGGYSVIGAAIAVALSSIRFVPMVAAFVPEMRGPKSRKIVLLFLSHFIAVTAWVLGMEHLRNVPVHMRTSYFAGLGITLTTARLPSAWSFSCRPTFRRSFLPRCSFSRQCTFLPRSGARRVTGRFTLPWCRGWRFFH